MKYIQYPIEVSNINTKELYKNKNKPDLVGLFRVKCGSLVMIRPCEEEYKNKTYLGIMIGDLPLSIHTSYNNITKELEIEGYSNPAIFVPELSKIIWGLESWWSVIENEDQLKQITDDDIKNTWYVKALKAVDEKIKGND